MKRSKNAIAKYLFMLVLGLGCIASQVNAQEALDKADDDANGAAVAEALDEPAPLTPEQKEAAAAEKQANEQKIARWAIPMVSGIAIGGLDPEAPEQTGILVLNDGKAGLGQGSLAVNEGNYNFNGSNLVPEDAKWVDVPFNKAILLGAVKWIALSAVLGWPFVAFILRGTMYTNESYDPTSGSYFFRFVGWMMNLMVMVLLGALFLISIRRPELWPDGPSVELSHVLPIAVGVAVLAGLSLLGAIVSWAKGYWRFPSRLHYLLTVVSALGFLWYLSQTGVLRHVLDNMNAG